MKKIFFLFLLFLMCFCKSKKEQLSNIETLMGKTTIESLCPENGHCIIELFKNKKMAVKTDEFGAIYYTLEDSKESSVIKYSYIRETKKNIQDANYREEIVFEFSNTDKNINLSNMDLQKTKMLYGRFCFCKGYTGNYKVEQGNLQMEINKQEIHFNMDFKVDKIPQKTTTIVATIH